MNDNPGWAPSGRLLGRGIQVAIDATTAEVWGALEDEGIAAILLKGPSFAMFLYGDRRGRLYSDTDLLVAPGRREDAERVLSSLGFVPFSEPLNAERPVAAQPWIRNSDKSVVDLHDSLPGAAVPNERVWAVLSPGIETMTVGGREVSVLGKSGRALHVALHAAQHGIGHGSSQRDLEAAVSRLPRELWHEAHTLAESLGCLDALAAGLRLDPEGAAVAAQLGLPEEARAETVLRAGGPPPLSLAFEWLGRSAGLWSKARFVAGKAFPPPDYIRQWSPRARKGVLWLLVAYIHRPFWLLRRAPRAIKAVKRARALERRR